MKKIFALITAVFIMLNTAACAAQNVSETGQVQALPSVSAVTEEKKADVSFSDVDSGAWYAQNVADMAQKGYLSGYEDGTFRPNGTITYAEFVTIVKRCATGSAAKSAYGHWAKDTMEYAYKSVWYDYDEINEGIYDMPIPRYMAVKILALGMKIPENEHDGNVYWQYMNEIKDFNSIDGRYAYLVVRAYNNGILTGDESGMFNPKSNLTRAEACAIISRALGFGTAVPAQPVQPTAAPVQSQTVRSGGVSENGKLQVIGTQLCNAAGQPIQLRGMSSHGLHWYPQYTSRESIACTASFGANLFRVAMYTGENGYISQPDNVKNLLITAVDNAVAEDMYVIIDWHILSDGNPMTYAEQSKAFFNEISARYANTPNVIYEICNEPNGGANWENDIKPYAESVIPVIRANSPESVILVGSGTWSQDVDKPADNPLSFGNVMYTCHFYAGTHGQWLRDRIDYALSKGAPIFISEWGTSAADGSGGVFLKESQEWLVFLNQRGISWANWSLCDKGETSAALKSGASSKGWSENELTESGRFVFGNFR